MKTVVKFKMNEGCEDLKPTRAHDDDAAFDLRAEKDMALELGEVKAIPVGFTMALEKGWEGQIRPRSGLALKQGLTVKNSPGTIDCVTKDTKITTLSGKTITAEEIFSRNDKVPVMSFNEEDFIVEEDVITDCWVVNGKKLVEIQCEESEPLMISEENEIFTRRGWVKAKDITSNDEILSF